MAKVAWKEDFVSGAEHSALLQRQLTMGARHLDLGWRKTLWIDHMYVYVARWGTIVNFSWFALEGIGTGGVSVLNDRSGRQCVVDNDTLDDNLRKGGSNAGARLGHVPGGGGRGERTW